MVLKKRPSYLLTIKRYYVYGSSDFHNIINTESTWFKPQGEENANKCKSKSREFRGI